MALKLFRRKSKAAVVAEPEKAVAEVKKIVEDVLPEDGVKVERVAVAPVDKQETIEEEGDVSTVESAVDEPANEEAEPTTETTEGEQTKEQSSPFACCQGSPADVMKNLQAAVGMA